MSEGSPGGRSQLESLTTPQPAAVQQTFVAIKRTVDSLEADSRAVSQTLGILDDGLQLLTEGSRSAQDWGGFGVVGLPIAGALRAARAIASQHVKQQTGVPLSDWAELVATSSARFSAYVSRLDTVVQLCERYRATTEDDIDLEQLRADMGSLSDARWQTQAWKQILSRVAELCQVVEAILQTDLAAEGSHDTEPVEQERSARLSASLQRRLKDVQSRTGEKSADLTHWVLKPFVDVRDKVRELPQQIEHLSHDVTLLEVLLDLQVAEMRAHLGDISHGEAEIVGIRVAVGVLLPELAQELEDARRRVLRYEAYLDRLDDAHNAGGIDDRARAILSEEYREALQSARSELATRQARAEAWRRDGKTLLDASADWAKLQLEVLTARRIVEQDRATDDRGALLRRELELLDEAGRFLASL